MTSQVWCLDTSEGDRIAEALGDKKAAILKNHGLLTTGQTVDEAAWGFLSMDRCCQSQLLAETVGQMERIPDEVAELTKRPGWLAHRYVDELPTYVTI